MKKTAYKIVVSVFGPVGLVWCLIKYYLLQRWLVLFAIPRAETYQFPNGDVGATEFITIIATLLSLMFLAWVVSDYFE